MATTVSQPVPGGNFSKGALLVSLALMVILDIGLSILIFSVARSQGASDTVAYLLASLGPLAGMLANWIRTREIGGVSVIILVTILISAAVSLIGTHDPRILLLKDSALTGGFGFVTLISALPIFPKPLMFFFGLKFATDGTRAGTTQWYDMFDKYPAFRSGQYLINAVWGVSFLVEALIKAACSLTLPYDTAYTINQIFPFAVLAGVLLWTFRFGQKQRAQAAERANQAEPSPQPDQSPPAVSEEPDPS